MPPATAGLNGLMERLVVLTGAFQIVVDCVNHGNSPIRCSAAVSEFDENSS